MNKSGRIGTAAETAVVNYLRANGFPHVERRRLRGAKDAGDLAGIPGVLVEVKGGDQARNASDNKVDGWLDAAWEKARARRDDLAFLVVARPRKNVSHWWGVQTRGVPGLSYNVRMYLKDAALFLRSEGYGEPL